VREKTTNCRSNTFVTSFCSSVGKVWEKVGNKANEHVIVVGSSTLSLQTGLLVYLKKCPLLMRCCLDYFHFHQGHLARHSYPPIHQLFLPKCSQSVISLILMCLHCCLCIIKQPQDRHMRRDLHNSVLV
jgi:hypothetical protein